MPIVKTLEESFLMGPTGVSGKWETYIFKIALPADADYKNYKVKYDCPDHGWEESGYHWFQDSGAEYNTTTFVLTVTVQYQIHDKKASAKVIVEYTGDNPPPKMVTKNQQYTKTGSSGRWVPYRTSIPIPSGAKFRLAFCEMVCPADGHGVESVAEGKQVHWFKFLSANFNRETNSVDIDTSYQVHDKNASATFKIYYD